MRTSGSTGQPQLVQMKRRQLEASARRTGDYFDLGPGDRMLVCLNCEFVGGLMMLVRGLERNAAPDHRGTPGRPAGPGAADENRERATVRLTKHSTPIAHHPTFLHRALAAAGRAGRRPRPAPEPDAGHSGGRGGRWSAASNGKLQQLCAPLYLTYGMTETASHIALRRLNGPEAGPAYRVLPGVAVGQDGPRLPHRARRRNRQPAHHHQRPHQPEPTTDIPLSGWAGLIS